MTGLNLTTVVKAVIFLSVLEPSSLTVPACVLWPIVALIYVESTAF